MNRTSPRTRTRSHTRTRVAAGATALAATSVIALAGTAQAHVSIDPDQAEQGGYSVINIKVPNERDNASTIRLELHLDPDHPLSSVMPQPVPGWDVEVETAELDEPMEVHGTEITEAPSTVTWTGGAIEPGTFQQFPLSVGPLPEDADRLVFDAIQTYDNDEVVRWIEEPAEGQAEPEYPSPVLELAAAPADGEGEGESATDDDDAAAAEEANAEEAAGENAAAAEPGSDDAGSDTTARVLAGIGILVGAAGLAFGVVTSRRRA
ncbi:YcnI family copper-binding membrane protein [Streptomyces sp. 6N223]|uniref:YcnI family copper-binding membrane protein n=1 Tax=Streptomyces sp. 6N223 TaxID=3457412 RepID=UPI003FD5BCE9